MRSRNQADEVGVAAAMGKRAPGRGRCLGLGLGGAGRPVSASGGAGLRWSWGVARGQIMRGLRGPTEDMALYPKRNEKVVRGVKQVVWGA